MIKNLLANWKTSSAGVMMICTGIVKLVFAIKHGTADEMLWGSFIATVLGGIGLLAAGDANKSQSKEDAAQTAADLANVTAMTAEQVKAEIKTAFVKKTDVAPDGTVKKDA